MLIFNVQDPVFEPKYHLSLADFRQLTVDRLVALTKQEFFKASDYKDGILLCYVSAIQSSCKLGQKMFLAAVIC